MASATFERVDAVRAAIAPERRSAAVRSATASGPAHCARRRRGRERREPPARARGLLRGVGASVLIASGYVAAVSALRALIAAA
jgi:hypothetical protein